jgi:uncharacterized protein (DUF488 family)
MRTIYMIGHSKHPVGDFVTLLRRHGVEHLVDVRTHPRSRFCPQFNRDKLDQALQREGIGYRWLPALGGLEPLPPATILETLAGLLNDPRTICLMCSEGEFQKCHRHYLLAPLVASLGCQVQQITPTGALTADPGPRQQQLEQVAP